MLQLVDSLYLLSAIYVAAFVPYLSLIPSSKFILDFKRDYHYFPLFPVATDTTPPIIANCPQDIFEQVQMGSVLNIGWIEPTATDLESPPVTLLQTHRSGDSFTLGTTPVSYVFSDAAGNQATCMFTVTLEPGK